MSKTTPATKQPWMNKCSVCGTQAEVSHPDGYGGQEYFCGFHEPETLLTEIEREEEDHDATEHHADGS